MLMLKVKLGGAVAGLEPKNTALRWRRVKDSVAPALKHSLAISARQQDCGAVCSWSVESYLGFSRSWYDFGAINLSLPTSRVPSKNNRDITVVRHFGEINGFAVRHASRMRQVICDIVA